MAGDWIKMRTDLYRDPKVCVMADLLMDESGPLSRFVCQNQQRHMTVTRNVTRNACVGALLSVWGVVRHRGKRVGDDLRCAGVTVSVIDDIADLPGFGEAMEHVGWVIQRDDCIVFPRFFSEYNAEPTEKPKSSGAERQARYRQKRVASHGVTDSVTRYGAGDVTRDVTRDVTVTPREEKRREENTASAVCVGDTPQPQSDPPVVDTQSQPPPKPRAFAPPTVDEVRAYVAELKANVDADRFVDFYASKGWMVGKNAMKDWKAAVRTWARNEDGSTQTAVRPAPGGTSAGPTGRSREQQREDANHAAIAGFLQRRGLRAGDAGADDAEANSSLHAAGTGRLALRVEAVPGPDPERGGCRTGNVGNAVPRSGGPVPPVSAEDAAGVLPKPG